MMPTLDAGRKLQPTVLDSIHAELVIYHFLKHHILFLLDKIWCCDKIRVVGTLTPSAQLNYLKKVEVGR